MSFPCTPAQEGVEFDFSYPHLSHNSVGVLCQITPEIIVRPAAPAAAKYWEMEYHTHELAQWSHTVFLGTKKQKKKKKGNI